MSGLFSKFAINADPADLSNGDSIASYLVDSAGALLTSTLIGAKQRLDVNTASEFAEDSAHTSGDRGLFTLAVRNDVEGSMVSADGDYAPLQVDALGRLRVNADINVSNDFVYAEDAAAVSGNLGASVLLVRQDTLASSTSADGDYGQFKSNAAGELYVADSTARTSLASILAELQSVSYPEDSGHVSGDPGIFALAVRNDANTVLTSADLDYSPIAVDSAGRLKVISSTTNNFEKAEDSASVSGDIGAFVLAVRNDATSTLVSANGDYAAMQQDALGRMKVIDRMDTTVLQQVVNVATTATALPTTALANRHYLLVQNNSTKKIYIGAASVTDSGATQGIIVKANDAIGFDMGPNLSLFAVVSTGTADINVIEFA